MMPAGLRTPERVLTGAVNNTTDVWSFGCLVFELLTGMQLFCVSWSEWRDDDHIFSLIFGLGALPDDLFKQWKNSSLYYPPEGKVYNCHLGGAKPGQEPLMISEPSTEEYFDELAPEIDEKEAQQVKTLLRWILQYDPVKRPSLAQILADPWFSAIEV